MEINNYRFGKIVVENTGYTSDVIIAPEQVIDNWWRKEGHKLHIEDLKVILEVKPDILVIGTGCFGRMLIPEDTRKYLETKGIEVRDSKTTDAVKEFNELQKRCARVVAALHLTC